MADRVPMTIEGHQRLKDELKRLKETDRPSVIREIETARAHGDLSENAEYHAAKERQGFIEARIRDVDHKLGNAEVIDTTKLSGERVVFGARVRLADTDSGKEVVYRIVGVDQADLKNGLISFSSPVARAIIGKTIGDVVTVHAPNGAREFEILDVSFDS